MLLFKMQRVSSTGRTSSVEKMRRDDKTNQQDAQSLFTRFPLHAAAVNGDCKRAVPSCLCCLHDDACSINITYSFLRVTCVSRSALVRSHSSCLHSHFLGCGFSTICLSEICHSRAVARVRTLLGLGDDGRQGMVLKADDEDEQGRTP